MHGTSHTWYFTYIHVIQIYFPFFPEENSRSSPEKEVPGSESEGGPPSKDAEVPGRPEGGPPAKDAAEVPGPEGGPPAKDAEVPGRPEGGPPVKDAAEKVLLTDAMLKEEEKMHEISEKEEQEFQKKRDEVKIHVLIF
jgi:hypothetical protein